MLECKISRYLGHFGFRDQRHFMAWDHLNVAYANLQVHGLIYIIIRIIFSIRSLSKSANCAERLIFGVAPIALIGFTDFH